MEVVVVSRFERSSKDTERFLRWRANCAFKDFVRIFVNRFDPKIRRTPQRSCESLDSELRYRVVAVSSRCSEPDFNFAALIKRT
jgi:hypothetical protein